MALPQIPNIEQSREYIQEFKGYNHNLRIAENEFYNIKNFTSDNYPVLSTRKGRTDIDLLDAVCAVAHGDDLYYVKKTNDHIDELRKYCFDKREDTLLNELAKQEKERSLVFMGARLCIFPDCCIYDTITGKLSDMETLSIKPATQYSMQLQYNNGSSSSPNWKNINSAVVKCTQADIEENPKRYKDADFLICTDDIGRTFQWIGKISVPENIEEFDFAKHIDLLDLTSFRLKVYFIKKPADSSHVGRVSFEPPVLYSYPNDLVRKDYDLEKMENAYGNETLGFYIDGHIILGYLLTVREGYAHLSDNVVSNRYGDLRSRRTDVDVPLDMLIVYEKLNYNFEYDFVVECQNRLWACYQGETKNGEYVNEIFCSALGNPGEWNDFYSLSGGAYRVSVGTPGRFTGATVVNQNPVFFKEDCVHKVYVSSAGDHQLLTLNCPGIEEGSSKSIARVNGMYIYKARNNFVIFDGSNAISISANLGDVQYKEAIAGASENKYVVFCREKKSSFPQMFVYDTNTGLWHKEDTLNSVVGMAECDGKLCVIYSGGVYIHDDISRESKVDFILETGEIGFGTPDKKYISRIDLCISLSENTYMQVFMQYDSDGIWIPSGSLLGTKSMPKLVSLPIIPKRCAHFKICISGNGAIDLYSIAKLLERGE